jgi:hypothetical protein
MLTVDKLQKASLRSKCWRMKGRKFCELASVMRFAWARVLESWARECLQGGRVCGVFGCVAGGRRS